MSLVVVRRLLFYRQKNHILYMILLLSSRLSTLTASRLTAAHTATVTTYVYTDCTFSARESPRRE